MSFEEGFFFSMLIPALATSLIEVRNGLHHAISPINLTVWFAVLVVAVPISKMEDIISFYGLSDGLLNLFLFLAFTLLGILIIRLLRMREAIVARVSRNPSPGYKHSVPPPDRILFNGPYWWLLWIGLGGYGATIALSGGAIAYYSAVHLRGLDQSISAYVYGLQYLIAPSVLALAVSARLAGQRQSLIVILAFLFLLFDAYVLGRRGTYIRIAIGLLTFYIAIRPTLNFQSRVLSRSLMALAVVALAGIIYITPIIRHYTALGQSFNLTHIIEDLEKRDVLAGSTDDTGNELVYAASLIEATDEHGLDFGMKWLYPFISVIPRQIWPNKPYYTNFSANNIDLIYESSRIDIARGAAPTFVADTYARFGIIGALVFLFALVVLDRHLQRALVHWTNLDQLAIGYLATVSFVYFLLQDFSQGMLHFIYASVPFYVISRLHRTISRQKRGRVVARNGRER